MSPLYLNEFSALHNNVDIIFCKTDFLIEEFSAIQKREIDTVLISGNSDYGIDDRMCSLVPTNMIQNIDYIEWGYPDRSFQDHSAISFFFDKIMDYKMILCPIGNGIDTHRLWEVLYCNRIPIIIKAGNYKIYELYEKLPIIILDSQQDLLDYNLIMRQYADCKSKLFDKSLLDMDYWIETIRRSYHEL